jgi:hypothetical protein
MRWAAGRDEADDGADEPRPQGCDKALSPFPASSGVEPPRKVRLMPAKDVKAYVKRNKNDAAED